jgi:hypothetical protein
MLGAMSGDEPPREAPSDAPDAIERAADGRDLVYVYGPAPSGEGMGVLRSRTGRIEMGELRELREGRPVQGEVVKLTKAKEHERLFDAETVYEPPTDARSGPGPAQVATEAYRSGWDRIFGARGGAMKPN